MAKSFNATWLGDGDSHAQIIQEGGLEFIKGRPTRVPGDLLFNGLSWAQTIRNNPMFAIDGDEAEIEEAPDEIAALKSQLDEKGVSYRANASAASLRDLLAKS